MAWVEIAAADAPASNVFDFPSLTLTGYSVLQVVCSGIRVTTDATDLALQFYVSAALVTTGYRWGNQSLHSSTSLVGLDDGDTSDPSILLCSNNVDWDVGNAAEESFGGVLMVDAPLSTALYKRVEIEAVMAGPAGRLNVVSGIGLMENAGAIDGLKISGSSNLTAGKVRVLGLA